MRPIALALFLVLVAVAPARAELRQAPEWDVAEWFNGDGTTLAALRGKVVVIDFFQLWCPGCNAFSVPLMNHWEKVFADEVASGDIVFVSIHTVFEGHSYQNRARLVRYLEEKGIRHLVGNDRQEEGRRLPVTMRRWQTGGTPEMAVVDRRGFVRFQKLGSFDPGPVKRLIRELLAE